MRRLSLLTSIFLALIASSISARILNVPDQFPTIQAGIDSSAFGDTVLVEQGVYHENLIIEAKTLSLFSLFYMSATTDFISRTIIDGDSLGSVLTIQNSYNTVIRGFTIRNGYSVSGGGIKSVNSTPLIRNNYLINNIATDRGGGIYTERSSINIISNLIDHNKAEIGAGIYCTSNRIFIDSNIVTYNQSPTEVGKGTGIYCEETIPIIRYNSVAYNSGSGIASIRSNADIDYNRVMSNSNSLPGGGLYFENCRPSLSQNQIFRNMSSVSGGGIYFNSSNAYLISNTIVFNNSPTGAGFFATGVLYPAINSTIVYFNNNSSIGYSGPGQPSVIYSDIEQSYPGTGNISTDPHFINTQEEDFNISMDSPCLNTGDPTNSDPDGTRSDIGVFFQDHSIGPVLRNIWYVSPGGNDSLGDGSPELPFRTIQHAINICPQQDTIIANSGTYHETINFHGLSLIVASQFLLNNDSSYVHSTLIDADSAGSVVNIDNCPAEAALIGFTLQNGYSSTGGGGIHCISSNATIGHNIIRNCRAYGNSATGGGVYFLRSNSFFENNSIFNCRAGYGGGIYCSTSNLTIRNNSILENVATAAGGGIDCADHSNPVIANNIINANIAHGSGTAGGGIHVSSASHGVSSPTIINNVISNNIIDYSGSGGCTGAGISSIDANTKILYNSIYNNISSASGAGIFAGGAYSDTIVGNLIYNNSARNYGAGIHSGTTIRTLIASNTICNNISENSGGILSGNLELNNNIIWYNSLPQMSGSPVVSYCNIEGGWTGQGNIDLIPRFVNPDSFNYNICDASPCLNAGDPALQDPDGTRSDIGVYYPTHPECRALGQLINISTTGNDSTGDGSSLNPFRTIQHGWAVSREHDTVFVHPGTYLENPILTRKRANIVSNYSYSNDTLDIINTVIDGDSIGPALTFNKTDSLLSFTGFTITHGLGSGIKMDTSSSLISHCIIRDNWGSGIKCYGWGRPSIISNQINNNISDSLGGGILCINSRIANIKNNEIINNSALYGGGIFCSKSTSIIKYNNISDNSGILSGGGITCLNYPSITTIDSNIISNNMTEGKGGGIYTGYNTIPPSSIVNNIILANSAKLGAGCYFEWSESGVRNNVIRRNMSDSLGGALFFGSWINASHNIIDSNFAAYAGGGIYAVGGNVDSNLVSCNRAMFGSGIFGYPARISFSNINHNVADSSGGGIGFSVSSSSIITSDTICFNQALNGGGISVDNHSHPAISNCVINNNVALLDGGGLWVEHTYFTFKRNSYEYNFAGRNGGGIFIKNLEPKDTLSSGTVRYNIAGHNGGGIFCGYGWPYLSNLNITGNRSLNGGGLYADHANPTLMNTVFYGNRADSIAGGLYLGDGSSPVVRNSIFWGDSAVYGSEVWADSNTQRLISYSNIQGGFEGNNNIDSDPLFSNPIGGDFHLKSTACGDSVDSPCIDTGSLVDFDSLLNCSWGLGTTRCDMGIYGGGRWQAVGIEDNQPPSLPLAFSLSQNYPNPFNPATTIKYDLPSPCRVRIDIYDILGRRVATLVDEEQAAGAHQAIWNAQDKSSGIYFYRIQAGEFVETKKMMLMK